MGLFKRKNSIDTNEVTTQNVNSNTKKSEKEEKKRIENQNRLKELIRASLYGFVIGDALGVPVEFFLRDSLKENKVTDMREFGTHNQPKGTWSDDSSMVFATIDGMIKSSDSIDYKLIMQNFITWRKEGKYSPFDAVYDIGNTISTALSRYQQNMANNLEENYICGTGELSTNGNGSLMRILPVSLYLYYTKLDYKDEKFFEIIKNISSMTHSHNYSILACYIYSVYICELLKTQNKFKAYRNLKKICKGMEGIEVYSRIINKDIYKLKENEIKSSGYVVDSLEASMWSILTSKTYKDSLLKAVNLGSDTDTIGALTGALAGIIYGYNSIPQEWLNSIQKKEYVDEMINSFVDYLENLNKVKIEKNDENNTDNIKSNDEKNMDIKILEDTIEDLKNNSNASTIAESNLSVQLEKFIHYLYEKKLIDSNYMENYKKIENKTIDDLSFEEVITRLTFILRGDRFSSGLLKSKVDDGTILKLLERLKNTL